MGDYRETSRSVTSGCIRPVNRKGVQKERVRDMNTCGLYIGGFSTPAAEQLDIADSQNRLVRRVGPGWCGKSFQVCKC